MWLYIKPAFRWHYAPKTEIVSPVVRLFIMLINNLEIPLIWFQRFFGVMMRLFPASGIPSSSCILPLPVRQPL